MGKRLTVCLLVALVLAGCERKSDSLQGKAEVQGIPKIVVEKEKTEREPPLPPEVRIKLRRDGKENYSWELNGSDVDQILKVNERLRKQLGGEQAK